MKVNEQAESPVNKERYLRIPTFQDLPDAIRNLCKEQNAVILAHYYQEKAIQDVADFIGDSLGLSQQAKQTTADIIVFAGVYFMAETAKILNPSKRVLLPDLNAGCSLADNCTAADLLAYKERYPDHVLVTYINCSAEVKAISDIICTSANAERIISSIPADKPIIFAPDRNLGKFLIKKTGRDMKLWDGSCVVHEAFSVKKLVELHLLHPTAQIVAHPESDDSVLEVANYVGSTSGMIDFVRRSAAHTFIVATEAGILHQMQKDAPGKHLIPAPVFDDNSCACSECATMRLNTLEKLYLCLRDGTPEINVPDDVAARALVPIRRMLELSI